MPIATIAAFWGVSFLFVITPGADWAYAMAAGLRNRTVLPAVGARWPGTWPRRPRLRPGWP
jgi:threonine/homoserine/homoserine lactone efflux protein